MDTEQLKQLIQTVSASNLTEFQYEENDVKLVMKKEEKIHIAASPVEEFVRPVSEMRQEVSAEISSDITEGNVITSPLVGTFYSAPAEDAAPFVQVGDTVKKGQTIAIVEAMKLMNEIESEFDGTVKEIFVENGQAVEYGQPLFLIG